MEPRCFQGWGVEVCVGILCSYYVCVCLVLGHHFEDETGEENELTTSEEEDSAALLKGRGGCWSKTLAATFCLEEVLVLALWHL